MMISSEIKTLKYFSTSTEPKINRWFKVYRIFTYFFAKFIDRRWTLKKPIFPAPVLISGGKPSTRFPPGRLEQRKHFHIHFLIIFNQLLQISFSFQNLPQIQGHLKSLYLVLIHSKLCDTHDDISENKTLKHFLQLLQSQNLIRGSNLIRGPLRSQSSLLQ